MVLSPVLAEVVGQDKVSTKIEKTCNLIYHVQHFPIKEFFTRTVSDEIS